MKSVFIPAALAACVLMYSPGISGAAQGFGAGFMVGDPTGLSGKLWLDRRSAVDAGVAWSFDRSDAVYLHSDYLRHDVTLARADNGSLGFYYGIGGRLEMTDGDDTLGIRFPLGLDYVFQGAPLDIFVEFAPVMEVLPDTDMEPAAALGVRYFFGQSSSYR